MSETAAVGDRAVSVVYLEAGVVKFPAKDSQGERRTGNGKSKYNSRSFDSVARKVRE
jgi:hypothetical protein